MTVDINAQLELEREMSVKGIERYYRIQDTAEQSGRAGDTSYGKRLIPEYVELLAKAIDEVKVKKRNGYAAKYTVLLRQVNSEEAAFITLRHIFDSLVTGTAIANLAISIGQRIEDQIRFALFEIEHKEYYDRILQDFKDKNVVSYRHMHRVLTKKANDHDLTWNAWTVEERLQVGAKLIDLCIESTGLIEKVTYFITPIKSETRVIATPETLEWITQHKEHSSLLHPETMPCIVPPCDWKSLNDGGYYTPEIRQRVPFIKIKSQAHRKAIKDTDFSVSMSSVNRIQKTAWAINTKVHDVMKEVWRLNLRIGMPPSAPLEIPESPIPPHITKDGMTDEQYTNWMAWKRQASRVYTAERERISKCIQLSRVLQMAEKFRQYERFYYVYNCDFRGRIYCASPGLSPQGADFSKGLLHFFEPKELGEEGGYWLAVHGANTYGYDKVSYDARREWVHENEPAILGVAADPLSSNSRSFWSNADKPYQFLAFCFEWAGASAEGSTFKSRLAVALDGSCNGLQNFSAMLRDSTGAKATNLAESIKPEDIYQRVSDVCIERLHELDSETAKQWLEFGVTRKCSKRPVMTLPYGSTRQSCREYIEDYIYDNIERAPWCNETGSYKSKQIFEASLFMSNIMWDAIGSVVVAAREAMDWLQSMTRILSKLNVPLTWTTPTGFKVYQGTMKNISKRIKTQLCGTCLISINLPTNEIDNRKQVLGISPNFVHSMDASHLVNTVALGSDIQAWAMIHDSYGTYACDTPKLHKYIREAFVSMYKSNDVLVDFCTVAKAAIRNAYAEALSIGDIQTMKDIEKTKLPVIPSTGDFDIEEVKVSNYFFG